MIRYLVVRRDVVARSHKVSPRLKWIADRDCAFHHTQSGAALEQLYENGTPPMDIILKARDRRTMMYANLGRICWIT